MHRALSWFMDCPGYYIDWNIDNAGSAVTIIFISVKEIRFSKSSIGSGMLVYIDSCARSPLRFDKGTQL
jgi:hypothetical protein